MPFPQVRDESGSRPPVPVYDLIPFGEPSDGDGVKGCWCVRYGDALAWVEASEADAVRRLVGMRIRRNPLRRVVS